MPVSAQAHKVRNGLKQLYKLFGVELPSQNLFASLGSLSVENFADSAPKQFVRILFDYYDKNANGTLDKSEVTEMVKDYAAIYGTAADAQFVESIVSANFPAASYTLAEFQKNEEALRELLKGSDKPLNLTAAPNDEGYVKQLPNGAQKIAHDLAPIFELFETKPDFSNLFKTLEQFGKIFDGPEGVQKVTEALLQYTFYSYDKDDSGFIDKEELKQVVTDCLALVVDPAIIAEDPELVEESTKQLLADADSNNDGQISLGEFVAHFMKAANAAEAQQ